MDDIDGRYRDRRGRPLALLQWSRLYEDWEYRCVADDTVGPVRVVTVWMGFTPMLATEGGARFSSCVFVRETEATTYQVERYWLDEEAAVKGHHQLLGVAMRNVQAGYAPMQLGPRIDDEAEGLCPYEDP